MTTRTASTGAGATEHNSDCDPQRVTIERQVFFEVINALNAAPNLDELFAQVHLSLQKVLSAANCYVALYNQQSGMFHFPFYVDQFDAPPLPSTFGRSCAAYVFRSGRPMHVTPEVFERLAAAGEVESIGTGSRAWLGVPLRTPLGALGVLVVQDYENENAYSEPDLTLLSSIGGSIARAIEYKQAEEALRKQQTEYEVIFHSAPLMIMYKDADNRVLWANRAAAHAFGKTVKEIEGCSIYDLCPSEAVIYHQDDLEVIRTGQPKLGVVEPLRLASGDVRLLSTDKIPYRNQEGEIIGVVLFATDVTEKQRAEDAMRRSEVNYRSVVQGAPYGICRVGEDGHLFNVNPALVSMLGYPSEKELLSANLDRDIFREPGARAALLREGEEVLDGAEVAWIRKDGSAIQVRLSGWPVRDPEWPSTCYELIAENVTEQRALEQQFRQVQKMEAVGRLAGGIAHDFNNLLTVIKGHTELLHDRAQTDEPRSRANLEQIQKAADRAAGLTRQLLAFSRMQMLQPKVIDLNEVVADMGKMLPRLIGENIDLRMDLKPALERVKADPGQIEQVIMNLVVNARDAMPQGGKIVIETGNAVLDEAFARLHPGLPAGRYAMLAVTDTGTGMDAETQAHIFEPFFTTKEVGKGTGLGLATVYGVVKQSGGHISVDSQPGKGTSFRIYLPPVPQSSQPSSSIPEQQDAVPAGSGTVLIAEDEREVRELAREFLSLSGYTVLEASDGVEALEIAERTAGAIDLLITDVVMPRMGGRELVARMTALRPATKILYISGYAEYAPYHEESGETSSWLSKPFTRMALARIVDQLLRAAKP
jgi:two-component system, cell cycle sensor histidine kinase and response regulator CckA